MSQQQEYRDYRTKVRKLVERWFTETPQVDGGNCAVCKNPGRYYGATGIPLKCPNPDCLSNAMGALI
jgi:hypothetical protein